MSASPRCITEIQALRAVAVILVVAFHLSPSTVTGGYVGVDIFFVISGFLITAHLLREVQAHQRIRLGQFWARRIRRLLPAAFLVLVVTTLATFLLLPDTLWRQTLKEVGASAIYLQNWVLAFGSTDYFAESEPPTPVRHYWSLSVEEQFYLIWPVLIGIIVWCWRRSGRRRSAQLTMAAAIAPIFLTSLAYSIDIARQDQQFGYFSPLAHGWELIAGGLLALSYPATESLVARLPRTAALASWLGWVLIFYSSLTFTGVTPFPGSAALVPTIGTLMIITSRQPPAVWSPNSWVNLRPVQYLGEISYAIYLWHWPLIVLSPYLTARPVDALSAVGIGAATLGLAAITKVLVEDKVRFGWLAKHRLRHTFTFLVVCSLVIVGTSVVSIAIVDRAVAASREMSTALTDRDCFGAAALFNGCDRNHRVTPGLGPQFARADSATPWLANHGEFAGISDCPTVAPGVTECTYGPTDSPITIALVGDSHALSLLPALYLIAKKNNWQLKLLWRLSCRPAIPTYHSPISRELEPECVTWKENIFAYVANNPQIDLVVTSGATRRYAFDAASPQDFTAMAKAFRDTWKLWQVNQKKVIVVSDVPWARTIPADCIAEQLRANPQADDPCAEPISQVRPDDPMDLATTLPGAEGVDIVDLSSVFCDQVCHFVIGGVITHKDEGHLAATFAATLVPFIEPTINRALH